MYEFKFPDVGEGIAEGEIVKWHVKEGDEVRQDQIIAEVETDKAIVQIPSPRPGKILKLLHKEGDTIKVGEVFVIIGEKTDSIEVVKEEKAPIKEIKKEEIKEKRSIGVVGVIEENEEEVIPAISKSAEGIIKEAQTKQDIKVLATPATRRLARELGVDIKKVQGTGIGGRITEDDIRNFHTESTQEEKKTEIREVRKYDEYGHIEHVILKGIRKSTAKKMSLSVHTAAHVTHMDEIDVTKLVKLRESEKKNAEKKGIKLTYLPFIIKSVIAAMKEDHPYLNATLDDEHEEIILKKYYNIGFAIDTPEGLMVPVIKGADEKSILDIAKEMQELSEKAKNRTIDLGDLKGGTFTITNIGSLGGIFATPIINYPEVAILAVGKICEKPVVLDGKIKIGHILPVSLSFDHRVLDGAEAAKFVNAVKEHLEDPGLLLIERD
ncbi:MAG: dihydrolipoamide acetyltransferase family protein [Nanoarchaeota archaeon]